MFETTTSNLKAKISSLQTTLTTTSTNFDSRTSEILDLKSQLASLQTSHSALESHKRSTSIELSTLKSSLAESAQLKSVDIAALKYEMEKERGRHKVEIEDLEKEKFKEAEEKIRLNDVVVKLRKEKLDEVEYLKGRVSEVKEEGEKERRSREKEREEEVR